MLLQASLLIQPFSKACLIVDLGKSVKVGEVLEGSPSKVFDLVVLERTNSSVNFCFLAFKMTFSSSGVSLHPVNGQCIPEDQWLI